MNARILAVALVAVLVVALVVTVSAMNQKEKEDQLFNALVKSGKLTENQVSQLQQQADEMNARIRQDPNAFANLLADIASKNQHREEVPADRDAPAD